MKELLEFVQQTVSEERAVQIEQHVAACARCQRSFRRARLINVMAEPEAFRLPAVSRSELDRVAAARKRRAPFEALRCFLEQQSRSD